MSTLLLVEDDQSIVSSLSDYLGNEGFKIESASGQKEAIEKLNSDQYDLALVDIQLSNGNGFSVCSAIKERGTKRREQALYTCCHASDIAPCAAKGPQTA